MVEQLSLGQSFPNACRFARSAAYATEWAQENAFGSNVLWLTEWLCEKLALNPGMRVLDLGCGRAKSSIFIAREFGVQVWATDLWISSSENWHRIRDAGLQEQVFPIHADARSLPFAEEFFDAVIAIDSYQYYGTDDLFLNYLLQFVKPNARLGIASIGTTQEFNGPPPVNLQRFWTADCWCLHSADWWRKLWSRTDFVDIECADTMPEGWKLFLDWEQSLGAPEWYLDAIRSDEGQNLGYVRMVASRRQDAKLQKYAWPSTLRSLPEEYRHTSVLPGSPS
jgi:cyclopropane fatty-acyl-phospholipid synthase-like methyltransferase